MIGALLLAAGIAAYLRATRRREHEPRAVRLVLALPPPPVTWYEQYQAGRATWRGACAWCGRTWQACRNGCRELVARRRS